MLGTIPDTVPDPIMIEVFGLSGHFLETLRGDGAAGTAVRAPARTAVTEIRGFPAAKGVVEGVARVITTVGDLHRCSRARSWSAAGRRPSGRPRSASSAACVCDTGGSLTHAAIVSREYGIPCVVGTAIATQVDQDRRPGPGGRPGGHGPGPRVSVRRCRRRRSSTSGRSGRRDAGRVGPKMARLGQLAADGWRVPDGYAVTAGALDGLAAGRGPRRARPAVHRPAPGTAS